MKKTIAWSLVLLLSSALPGLAQQTGQDAFDAWIADIRIDGLSMQYGSAVEQDDGLTISDFVLRYSGSFPVEMDGDAPSEITITVGLTAPEIVAVGLSNGADGLSADRFDFTDVMEQDVIILVDGESLLELEVDVHNYKIGGMVWPQFPELPSADLGDVRAWIDWYRTMEDFRVDEATSDIVSGNFTLTDHAEAEGSFTSSIEYKDFRMEGMRDGRIALYSLGQMVQESQYLLEGAPYAETTTMESSVMKNLNAMAVLELFEPKPAGTAERVQFMESFESIGNRSESDLMEYAVDRFAYEDISVRAPETDIVALMEQLFDDAEPDASVMITAMIDLYRSFSIGSASMEGFEIKVAAEGENISAKLDRFEVTNLSSDGLGELVLEGLDADAQSNGRSKFDRISLREIEFPPYGPIKDFVSDEANWDNPDPLETTRMFFPLSFVMEMQGVFASSPLMPSAVKMDSQFLEMRTQIPPVPTQLMFSIEGLEIPASFIEDPEAQILFEALGIDVLRLSEEIRVSWNENTEDLIVENIMLDLGQIGRISAKAVLGGVPRTVMENPQQAQALMFTLNVKSVDLELLNDGGVQAALALYAQTLGSGEDAVKEQLLLQLSAALGQVGNDAFSEQVMTAARAFLDDPKNLTVTVAPSAPVPAAQIMSDAMAAPDALPERLGITVEANQ